MSNYAKPVMGATEDTVESSLNVILNSGEPSLGKSSEILVPETLESLKEAGMLPLPDCSNFTEETSKVLLVDNLDTVKGICNPSSNKTEEYSKFTSADTLHSVEGISKLSLVDAPDRVDEENSKLSLIETVDVVDGSSNLSLIEISNSMELCCEQMFSETSDAEENSKLSLDVAAGALGGRCTPSLVEASNSIEENANSVDIISNKPVLAAESSEISVTESVEENLTVGLPETSDSVEHNVRSPLIDSLEDISESLFREGSVEQNCCPSSAESLYSLEENSKSASTEIPENVEENSKLTSAESLDAVEEKPKSTSTESSDSVEENLESFESVVEEEESKSISIESFDSVKEIHSPILRGSSYSLEEDSKFIPTSLDAVKDHRLLSTEISDCLEKDYKSALTGDSESMAECSKSVSAENSELTAENPQLLLPDIVYSMDICKPLPHESSDVVNINSGVVLETSDALKGKSKRASSVTQDGGELTSSRILRSNSSSLTKSVYFTEENETISLHQRLLRSKTEVAINDQLAGSGRVSRKSFAVSVTKPVESVSDFNDHHKADGNRVLRSSGTLKNDEPSVDQEGAGDMDVGHSKCRSKASTVSTHARHTRLRKFSRRVRGEQLQEEWQLDPETLFYCRIAGNIQENLLHHLDGKLEHEVTVMSRDWNRAGPSQPHVSATTTNQEEKHYHHHRAPWEKFNFPKNYDGRCGEGAVCLASYIKDMSHLDISTQLTMRQNLKRLTAAPPTSRSLADVSVEVSKDDVIGFSRGLCLSAKVCADRRRSLRSAASRGRDAPAAAPGGAASTFTASASLKRWSSADDVAAAGSVVELSGEWVRPRSYICAACGVMFGDLWDLEDHKYSQHPNVWCTHYEFDQAALEQGAEASKFQGGSMSPKDLCRRFLLVREAMETVSLPLLSSEVKCTKCERGFSTLPELHRHILECGGDTTWMLLPSPNTSGRRARKWRPFGSRRRRQQGSHRRGMKRNIPTTPVKQYFRARHRTVAGDSIQRMLANLPAKRSTRRVIQFSEDEIKTRSQGTMHSNRLLRKRYKVSFASGVLRTSQKTGHRVVQSMQVKVTAADSSDSASKKLTVRTPKKLPAAPFVTSSVTSEQSYVPKQQLTVKKQPRSKSQPVASVPQSKSTGSDVQKKASRGGRSLSPATSKSEPVPLNGSEDTKQPSVHKCRGRSKKKQNLPSVCGELTEPTKKNDGPDIGMQEFDIDFGTGGSTETSNILAAMRIAMLEGVITETPPSVAASTKKVRKKSAKKHPCTEENETVSPGKRKKLVSGQKTLMKRKTKLSQSELEERFLRNKGYTHPDEITDEPIICKGCGLQFDNGSAELRHRKTCIYVPPEEDVGSNEVERSHPCSHCRAQFPSASTLLKHTQQCKAAVKGNAEATGEPSTSPKKTAAKAKTRNVDNNQVSTATSGKEEDYLGPKRSLANVGNSSENGSTKVKPGVTESKKQITKRSASNSRIIKRKKFDLANSTDDNLDATKKWLTGAENIRSCTTKRKVKSEKIFRTSPVAAKKKPDIVENTHSNPVEANKRLDNTRNLSNSPIKTKKKQNGTENDRNSAVGKKKKPCSSEDVSNGAVVLNGSVSGTQSANGSPRKTKKKKHNGTEIGSGNPLRTKTKLDASNRPVSKNKKLVELESSSDSPAGIGILEGVNGTCTGAKKQIRNTELGSGPVVSRKKQGNVRRSVSSSPVGSKKKLGSSRNYSLVESNRKFESTSNVSGGVVETGQQRPITQSDGVCPDGKEPLNHSESEIEMKRVECDGIENGAESVINNPAKRKKRLSIGGSGGGGPVTTNSRLENGEPANIILTGTKKKSGDIDVLKGAKTKSRRCDSMSDVVSERKDKCSSTGKGTCRPPNGDVDDKMPELQKEEPIENLKTETPSPKVEDLCDIPILSPVGFEPLGVGCEEKKSDADHGEMLRKNTAKKEQSLLVQGKKQAKVTVKKGTGLKQVTKTVEIRKPSPLIEKKDAVFEIPQIPLQIHPSKEEILVAVVEAGGLSSEGEVDCDDKPLAECLGVSVTSDKDEAEKDLWEQDVKKAASLSKQQKRKRAQHKNAILLWEGRYKEEAAEASTQPTEEDSNDDLLPISKLKEVIQKKTLPTEEIYSNVCGVVDENCLIGQMNSRVIEGSLVERNPLTVTGACEVFESENVAQHNIEEPLEIPDHVATFRRSAVKKGKRGRTQSRAHQKVGLPGGYPEAASVSGVHAGIQPEAGNIVIYKGKTRNYSEQVESQDSTRVENSVYLIGHEGDIKKKLKRQFDEMESRDDGSTDSTVMQEETRNCLFGGNQETNSSVVNEKIVTPLHLYEETSSTVGRKLMVTKRKKFGPRFESAASPLDPVNNAVTCVGRDKRTDHLVDDEHGIKILDVGERRKEMQRERRSSVVGKKSGVTKTKSKRQLDERSSQCKGNAVQTRCEMQEEETGELIGERVAGSDRANSVVGRKLIAAKRRSKHNSENRYDSGEVVDSTVDQGKYLRPISGKEAERNRLGIGEQQDGLALLCEEEETERHAKEPVVEAVSSCEEIKVGRRREVRNLTGKKMKANRLVDVAKETLQKDVKKANSLTNKTEETRQKIKIIIGKRRKRCLTIVGDQACRLISEEEDKPATYSVKEDVSLGYVGKGDQVKAVEISAKDELSVSISEEDDTVTSVADTDGTINLNCEAENMNVLTCTAEETTNTLVSVAEKTAKRLNTETGETGTSVCWKEETVSSLDGEEVIEDKFREKELSNLDINTSQPAVENEVGLFMHVKRKDVENMETGNVDDWEECAERMTDEQQEMNSEILGSDIAAGEKGAVPAKNENTDSPIHHENYLNPIIIQQGDMNNQIVQLDLSSSAVNIVSGTKAEESQVNVERPLRQARRTRCNTSYEELYTWSDVTSETEDSSQDLPDASVMTALCQDTDAPTYEQIAAMIVNGEHFFPSSSKKKKKKKLRNNSKQYRNGHLRRKRRKKQKLRTRLMKNKRSAVNDFIVTDIETGQEESQDSCESIELPEICKTAHRPMDTETDIKAIRRKKKKKRMKSLVKLESEGPENARVCNSDRSRQKRKSSVGSIFFCTLCNKHYSTNYNLMKHKLSLMHKRMSERYQPSIPTDVQKTDCEQWHSYALQNTTPKDTSQLVGQIIRTEQPNFATQRVETEQPSSENQKTETEPCNSDRHSLKNRQDPESVLHSVEIEQAYSSVHNTQFDESCSSLVESVESEHPFSSAVQNLETERSCVVLNENTECEEQCSAVQNVEGEEGYTAEPERTYTLMQNMDVEQFSSACTQSTSSQETEADESCASAEKPTSETDNEHILDTENAVQNSALDGAQQGTDPTQISSNAGARNDVAATGLSGIATVWTEHQANVTSEWLKKGRGLQQSMNSANWPASGEGQKQAGWFEGLVDNSEWVYTAGQWSQEMTWSREVNPDMNWNADSSQDDGTFFQSNSASLGSILDSVNQILDNERSADGLETTNRYPPYVDLLQSGTAEVNPNGGLRELQQAMGATDEEMAMLEQLGEGSWPLEDADIMDLDNQKSATATSTVASASTASTPTDAVSSRAAKLVEDTVGEGDRREEDGGAVSSVAVAQAAVTTRAVSGRSGLRTQDMQLARYESKDMVCPVCSRRFLGLTALRDHLAAAHNSSTRHRTQAVIKRPRIVPSSASEESGEPKRHVCLVCKELLPDEQGLADHVGVAHVERQNLAGKLPDQRPDGLGGSNHSTGGSGGGDEGLRSHMTSALGGLLTRALNNFLGKNRSQPSPPATQVPSPSVGSPVESLGRPLLTQPVARLLGRGLKMANRRHSSGSAGEQPFNCVDCDERFTSESNRNRHVARAHRGQQYRRLSTDSPLERTRTSSPLTSNESAASEVDTDSLPLSIRISNFCSEQSLVDSEPCKSQTAGFADSETSGETKDRSVVKCISSWKGEGSGTAAVQEADGTGRTACNSAEEEQLERATAAVARSADVGRRQEQEKLSESSRTDWRNGAKVKSSQPRSESLCGANDEDSIKAKAVAALRALNARDRRIRNGLPGTIGAAMWSGVSRKKSRGLDSDVRFRFPSVRKTPLSTNRYASLEEKKKKTVSNMVKCETMSQPNGGTEENRQQTPPSLPLDVAVSRSYDIYEFHDEAEQVRPPSEFGLAEFRLRAPLGKFVTDTGPSSDVEESKVAEWDSLLKDTQPVLGHEGVSSPAVLEDLENTEQEVFKPLRLSEETPKPKFSHSSRKHHSSKKKRWHRIIVDSEEDTSDTDTVAERHETRRVALDQRLNNHREREKCIDLEQRYEEGRGVKRHHVPCLSGVLVEDRQCGKRGKTARKPSKGSSKRATKTDLLMSVFAKSRQRNNCINSVAAGRSVPAKSQLCGTFSGPYRSAGTTGSVAGTVNKSDSGCSATSAPARRFATSSDDERVASGTKSESKKPKRGQEKMTAL
ncbi:uncharacterized protein LOC110837065 isoform X3 [Zootermopsis nevadensis]|uniref:uncharacterized protein LOC110837065 isoform X3 n=1 Tax=Zootermopsis nevadensis TaxID=136037 RepID=UPI000B8E2A82|nr:uncharacterized protein LOC110837065 isoform X3 [Zootermopsis nevadensis]